MVRVIVVGGGLAGAEAAWQVARRGLQVELWEMRPASQTPVHSTGLFAELVCSNSLGSDSLNTAAGLLKSELRKLGSVIMECADATRIPAGTALAVGREAFARKVTECIEGHPSISVRRQEMTKIPNVPAVIATGPLTSSSFSDAISNVVGQNYLYFYDALSPIIVRESVDFNVAFFGSRYDRGNIATGDYINCPFSENEYADFVQALVSAERFQLRSFETEDPQFFEGCLPLEVMAGRGKSSLAFGPLRPIGLRDPRDGRRPYAVAQLRQDDLAASLYNMVGFQTNLRWPEQKRVFCMIPGLAHADFVRYGQMHRNTYIDSPALLRPTMQLRTDSSLFFAGQITGVEGYVGNAATGLIAGINVARMVTGLEPLVFPTDTMIGALAHYVCHVGHKKFQPMKANFGLLPQLEVKVRSKSDRNAMLITNAAMSLDKLIHASQDSALAPFH